MAKGNGNYDEYQSSKRNSSGFEEFEREMMETGSTLREKDLTVEDCIDLMQRILSAIRADDVCVWDDPDNGQTLIVIPVKESSESS